MRDFDVVDETTAEDGTPFRVIIERDEQRPDLDPRNDYGNAGVIVALDTRDGRHWHPREDASNVLSAARVVDAMDGRSFPVVARWLRIFHGATVVLPLYEGTDGLSTGDADDQAGPDDYRGVTFDTPDTRREVGYPADATTPQRRAEVMGAMLAADVDTWATWARGDVFGYIVQRGCWDERDDDGTDEVVWEEYGEESVRGLIGEDYAREAARVALDDFVSGYNTDHPYVSDEDADLAAAELAGSAADL